MTGVSIVGPDEGELALSGPTQMRILEDGSNTERRLGVGEITIAPHTDDQVVLLNTFTPDLYVQYFRDLHDMIEAGEPLTPEASVAVMARYATTPATRYAP
jgi:hypothetical protein